MRNEARWIERCVRSLFPICSRVYVLDDHSDDDTAWLCSSIPNVTVIENPHAGLNETRDKNYLLDIVRRDGADWAVHIDGDEELFVSDQQALHAAMANGVHSAFAVRVVYLWNDERTIRTDGVYSRLWRPSVFRLSAGAEFASRNPAGFHCSNVPNDLIGRSLRIPVRLLHYGYMHREDRLRKFDWYNRTDPGNTREDGYRHMVQGDLDDVPADARLQYAGPLTLEPISSLSA